jgi:hypothetical protein
MNTKVKITRRQHGVEIEVEGEDAGEATAVFDTLSAHYDGASGYISKKKVSEDLDEKKKDISRKIATRKAIQKKIEQRAANGS